MDIKLFDSELKVMDVLWKRGDTPAKVLNPNSALEVFSSSESDSRIILAPINTKRKKAIHAENVST